MAINPILDLTHFDEAVPLSSVLGIRFWDPVRDRAVTESLHVEARPLGRRRPWIKAVRTFSGSWSFPRLPGVAANALPGDHAFLVRIIDGGKRFLPVTFPVEVPLGYEGLWQPVTASPPASPSQADAPGFYLFSAPGRPILPGWATIRARLWDLTQNGVAAFGVLEAELGDGPTVYGIADHRGEALVAFPYPRFGLPLTSPDNQGGNILDQQWPLTLRVRYQPNAVTYPSWSELPDFFSIRDQGPASFYPDAVPENQWEYTLSYQRELVLRTTGFSDLHVEP